MADFRVQIDLHIKQTLLEITLPQLNVKCIVKMPELEEISRFSSVPYVREKVFPEHMEPD